jgi:hypothetical protein
MAEAPAAAGCGRLLGVKPASRKRPFVNPDSAHLGPRREAGGASIIPPDATAPLDTPRRRARTVAGGATGREALDPVRGRAALQAIPKPESQIPDPDPPDFWRLQRKDIQYSGVALLLEFRCIDKLVLGRCDRSRRDRQILFAVDLERHRRRAEARAGIDLP